MKIRFYGTACCLLAMLLSSGCVFNSREVTVDRDDSLGHQREYFRNELVNPDGLALESENFLRGNLLQDDLKKNPRGILNRIEAFYRISGNPKYLVIAADLCRYLATQCDSSEAICYHLSNFLYCTDFARAAARMKSGEESGNQYNFTFAQAAQDYNEACCGIFRFLKDRNLLDSDSVALHDAQGQSFVMGKPVFHLSVPRDAVRDFSLCASYTVKAMRQINRQPGLGVPLVAVIKHQNRYASLKTPQGLTIPVTMWVKRENAEDGAIRLRLIFVDTGMQENFNENIQGFREVRGSLALDFSTPLACFLNNLSSRNLLAQMLNPSKQEASDGLYMIEPYQPGKIPVVFIHGLMSSPETWMQMINSLKNDPNIRRRYQFWFFSYSTGAPILLSALKLRKALLAAQKEFCTTPEQTENFNKMVLVGHSMGGMLTRQVLLKDQHYMVEKLLDIPWEQIKAKLQPEDLKQLELLVQPPLPFVHRAVFLASPHKGANLAQTSLARFGASIIKLPASLQSREDAAKRILKILNPKDSVARMQRKFYTGIDNLNPENPFVLAHGASQMKDDLVYHCIIGNIREDAVPGGSDGVVPYWSSHLDGAASELVVKSDHSVHRRPAAIQELLRILLLHLKAPGAEK